MNKLKKILFGKIVGAVIVFIVVFYVLTFLVYYFYGPGPEDQRVAGNEPPAVATMQVTMGVQGSTIRVENSNVQIPKLDSKKNGTSL